MGYDDDGIMRHKNIKNYAEHVDKIVGTMPQWMDDKLRSEKAKQTNNINFHGRDAQILLTISPDGRMILGPGISKDRATQEIAQMLANQYHQLVPPAEFFPEIIGYIEDKQLAFIQSEGSYREARIYKHQTLNSTPVYIFK